MNNVIITEKKRKMLYMICAVLSVVLIVVIFGGGNCFKEEDFEKWHNHRGFDGKEDHSNLRPLGEGASEHNQFRRILWVYSAT